jgi:hypothetical protein
MHELSDPTHGSSRTAVSSGAVAGAISTARGRHRINASGGSPAARRRRAYRLAEDAGLGCAHDADRDVRVSGPVEGRSMAPTLEDRIA